MATMDNNTSSPKLSLKVCLNPSLKVNQKVSPKVSPNPSPNPIPNKKFHNRIWLFPYQPIPNAKFRQITALLIWYDMMMLPTQTDVPVCWVSIQWQNVTRSGNRTQAASDYKSNTIFSILTWHVLVRRSLNICSCTTWYLNLDGFKENQ